MLGKRLPEIIKIGKISTVIRAGFQEHNTAALAAKKLESLGLIVNHDRTFLLSPPIWTPKTRSRDCRDGGDGLRRML